MLNGKVLKNEGRGRGGRGGGGGRRMKGEGKTNLFGAKNERRMRRREGREERTNSCSG